jgi:hypothetical protein
VCIDDYSRFIVAAEQFDRELSTAETVAVLEKVGRLPKAILSDHGQQFKEQWKDWCSAHGIDAQFAHILLIRRIRARLNVASETSTESSSISCGSFPAGLGISATTEIGLIIHGIIEASKPTQQTSTSVTLES